MCILFPYWTESLYLYFFFHFFLKPAAQALTSAWVELLASRHSAIDIVDALVQLAIRRPISRPQVYLFFIFVYHFYF